MCILEILCVEGVESRAFISCFVPPSPHTPDRTPPAISSVSISSSNPVPNLITNGNTLTLSLSCSDLSPPVSLTVSLFFFSLSPVPSSRLLSLNLLSNCSEAVVVRRVVGEDGFGVGFGDGQLGTIVVVARDMAGNEAQTRVDQSSVLLGE